MHAGLELPPGTDESEQSARRHRRDAASRGDPVAQLALVALELYFCVLELASTRAVLKETDEMDETRAHLDLERSLLNPHQGAEGHTSPRQPPQSTR